MNRMYVVVWTGTGNTGEMAQCIAEGVKAAGGEAALLTPGEFSQDMLDQYDVVAFGCPAMGGEELEEGEFEPMFAGLESALKGKKLALFGSYGWGDGEWMREWSARCQNDGAVLFDADGLMVNETPGDPEKEACRTLGKELAAW